jgi:protein-S-isoprenylcysteine O-methyltransferase Ste14
MERLEEDRLIKKYQLEHLVPFVIAILAIYFWINNFQQTVFYFFGLIISGIGLFVWGTAKFTIGGNWYSGHEKPKLKKLVTWGIYSKICHPIYWGINLTILGLCLVHQNIFLIIPSILIAINFFRRMCVEDKFLTKKLGKKYLDYKKKVWI